MKIKDKRGFISTIVIYSLFLLFLGALMTLMKTYTNNRLIVKSEKINLTRNLDEAYEFPIHYHVGDPILATGCYEGGDPIYHVHTDECYDMKPCGGTYVKKSGTSYGNHCGGTISSSWFCSTYHVGVCYWNEYCSSCGHIGICETCGSAPSGRHNTSRSYSYTQCNKCGAKNGSGTCTKIIKTLICPKTQGKTIDGYKPACGFEEGKVEF